MSNLDVPKILELAKNAGIADDDRENLIWFALGCADGARNADSKAPVQLLGAAVSANVVPVWTLLESAGIPHEFKPVDLLSGEHKGEEFLSLNPYHTVPTIKHGDFTLHESSAILRYIVRAFPSVASKFYGNGDIQKQAIIDAALDERQSSIYKKIAAILYPFIGFAPKQSEENVEKNVAALNETLATFESHFLKHGKFVAGDHPSIADLSIGIPVLALRATPYWTKLSEGIRTWATSVDTALPAVEKIFDGATNGQNFGGKQFIGMRAATYDATEVGAFNNGQ